MVCILLKTIPAAKQRRGWGQEWGPGDPVGYHNSPGGLDQGMAGEEAVRLCLPDP